ncbi:MAG TPA: hypothetical protein VHP38_02160 [Ruminiclostridium sp.]|nr:hypothetical protein [Ruminiclostridium sp.]
MTDTTQIIWISIMIFLMINSLRITHKEQKKFWGITGATVMILAFHWVVAIIIGVVMF